MPRQKILPLAPIARTYADRLVAVGESARDSRIETADLAAWTTVTSAILNLDETITKQ